MVYTRNGFYKCPRCKEFVLDAHNNGTSSLYRSNHTICVPCFHAEDEQIETEGTNNLPDVLESYGEENAPYFEGY